MATNSQFANSVYVYMTDILRASDWGTFDLCTRPLELSKGSREFVWQFCINVYAHGRFSRNEKQQWKNGYQKNWVTFYAAKCAHALCRIVSLATPTLLQAQACRLGVESTAGRIEALTVFAYLNNALRLS
jgi:hypothetical protein